MADPTERNSDLNDDLFESESQSNANQSDLEQPETNQPDATATDATAGHGSEASASDSDDTIESAPDTPTPPAVVGEDQFTETEEERAAREAEEELLWIFQATVFDRSQQKIGRVGQVYLDDQTQEPNWVTVKTGLFGMKEFFIPLDGSERSEKRITVPFDKATVLAAPRTEVDQNLSPSEEDALYNHYQVDGKTTEVISLHEGAVIPEAADPMDSQPEPAADPETATDFDAILAEETPEEGQGFEAPVSDEPATDSDEPAVEQPSAFEPPAVEQPEDPNART